MTSLKIKKSEYSDLEGLLHRAGLVKKNAHGMGPRASHPDRLYVHPRTYNDINRALTKEAKKNNPHLSTLKIKSVVGMHLLNIGPNVCDAVIRGMCVIPPPNRRE